MRGNPGRSNYGDWRHTTSSLCDRVRTLINRTNVVGCLAILFVTAYLSNQPPSSRSFAREPGCWGVLHQGQWLHGVSCESLHATTASCDANGHAWQWDAAARQCGARRIVSLEWLRTLQGRRIIFAGHVPAGAKHADLEEQLAHNVKVSFYWQPYPSNLTDLLSADRRALVSDAAAVVFGCGLWHALHVHDDARWVKDVNELAQAAAGFHQAYATPLFVVSVSKPVPGKVSTWSKWWHMTPNRVARYNRDLEASGVVQPSGPAHLLDLYTLSAGCGAACTADGVHYSNATYEALVHVMANILDLGP